MHRNGRTADVVTELLIRNYAVAGIWMAVICIIFTLGLFTLLTVIAWQQFRNKPILLFLASAFSFLSLALLNYFRPGLWRAVILFMSATTGYVFSFGLFLFAMTFLILYLREHTAWRYLALCCYALSIIAAISLHELLVAAHLSFIVFAFVGIAAANRGKTGKIAIANNTTDNIVMSGVLLFALLSSFLRLRIPGMWKHKEFDETLHKFTGSLLRNVFESLAYFYYSAYLLIAILGIATALLLLARPSGTKTNVGQHTAALLVGFSILFIAMTAGLPGSGYESSLQYSYLVFTPALSRLTLILLGSLVILLVFWGLLLTAYKSQLWGPLAMFGASIATMVAPALGKQNSLRPFFFAYLFLLISLIIILLLALPPLGNKLKETGATRSDAPIDIFSNSQKLSRVGTSTAAILIVLLLVTGVYANSTSFLVAKANSQVWKCTLDTFNQAKAGKLSQVEMKRLPVPNKLPYPGLEPMGFFLHSSSYLSMTREYYQLPPGSGFTFTDRTACTKRWYK